MITLTDLDKMNLRELREFAYISLLMMQYANLLARAREDHATGDAQGEYHAKAECAQIRLKLPKDKW